MPKKLFLISDVHDDLEALEKACDYMAAEGADRIIFSGDFSLRPYTLKTLLAAKEEQRINLDELVLGAKRTTKLFLAEAKALLDATEIPYSVIPGNYDGDLSSIFKDEDLHRKSVRMGDAKIVGYGGADAYPQHIIPLVNAEYIVNYNEKELGNIMAREKPNIMLLHNPPLSMCDDLLNGSNVGSKTARDHINEYEPRLVIAGHIHEAGPLGNNPKKTAGISSLTHANTNVTYVINPGNLGRFELVHPNTLETDVKFDFGTFVLVETEDDGTPTAVTQHILRKANRSIGDVSIYKQFTF